MVFDSRICHRNGRSNNRVERAGSTPAAQPDRYAHRVGREGEGCNTWRREGVLADQGNSVWVGPGEVRQARQTHPEILTSSPRVDPAGGTEVHTRRSGGGLHE